MTAAFPAVAVVQHQAGAWRVGAASGVSAKGQAAGRSAYRSVMDERQAAAEACSVCGVLVIVPWVILAAWRWTRVAVDRTGLILTVPVS